MSSARIQQNNPGPVILAYSGRSASCSIHVMLINTGKVASSEFMVSDFSFLKEWGSIENRDLTQRVCRISQEQSGLSGQTLWAHDPSEWVSSTPLALEDHDDCSCQTMANVHLFHSHSLLIDRRLFRHFVDSLSAEAPAPKIIVASRVFESAILTYFKNSEKRKWKSNYLYFLYVTLVSSISEKNVAELSKYFELFETKVEALHDNYYRVWSELEKFLGIKEAPNLLGGSNLKLRGFRWTGGYGDTQFDRRKTFSQSLEVPSPFFERLINWFDPNNETYKSSASKVARTACLVGGDLIALGLFPYFALTAMFRSINLPAQPQGLDPHLAVDTNAGRRTALADALGIVFPIFPYVMLRLHGTEHFRNSRKRLARKFYNAYFQG